MDLERLERLYNDLAVFDHLKGEARDVMACGIVEHRVPELLAEVERLLRVLDDAINFAQIRVFPYGVSGGWAMTCDGNETDGPDNGYDELAAQVLSLEAPKA